MGVIKVEVKRVGVERPTAWILLLSLMTSLRSCDCILYLLRLCVFAHVHDVFACWLSVRTPQGALVGGCEGSDTLHTRRRCLGPNPQQEVDLPVVVVMWWGVQTNTDQVHMLMRTQRQYTPTPTLRQ